MRLTASSMRALVTRPALTSLVSVDSKVSNSYGTMTMSMPALIEVRTSLG